MQIMFDEALISEIESFSQAFSNCEDILPGFSLAIKTTRQNLYGINEEILLVGQVSLTEKKIPDPNCWSAFRQEQILRLIQLPTVTPTKLAEGIRDSLVHYSESKISPLILFHAAVRAKYTCYCEPTSLMAIFCFQDAQNILADLFKQSAYVSKAQPNLHLLCQDIAKHAVGHNSFILTNRGLLVGENHLSSCRKSSQDLIQKASNFFKLSRTRNDLDASTRQRPVDNHLSLLRAQLSEVHGRPLVMHLDNSREAIEFSLSKDCVEYAKLSLPSYTLHALSGTPIFLEERKYGDSENIQTFSPESNVIVKPGLGIITAGKSKVEAEQVCASFLTAVKAIRIAYQNGILDTNPSADFQSAADWEDRVES